MLPGVGTGHTKGTLIGCASGCRTKKILILPSKNNTNVGASYESYWRRRQPHRLLTNNDSFVLESSRKPNSHSDTEERLVPRVGVEPTRPYGQRIVSPLKSVSPSLTKRYEPVFTRLSGCQGIASSGYVSTRRATILAPTSVLKVSAFLNLDDGSLLLLTNGTYMIYTPQKAENCHGPSQTDTHCTHGYASEM